MPGATALRRLVIRTRDWPVLGACYRAAYAVALRLTALLLAWPLDRSLVALYLRRGLSRKGLTPGVSDMDLLMVLDIPAGREEVLLRGLWRRYGWAKRLAPMLGELQVATPEEFSAYLAWGGIRRLDAPTWKPLRGAAPAAPADAGPNAGLQHLHEALAAYLFLAQTYFESARPPAAPDFGFRMVKGFLDVLRHIEAAQQGLPAAAERGHAHAGIVSGCPPEVRHSLRLPERMVREQAMALLGFALGRLDGFCSGLSDRSADPCASGLPHAAPGNSYPDEWLERIAKIGPGAGFFMDTMLHWYVVLPEAPGLHALRKVSLLMDHWHREETRFRSAGWLVTRNVFQGLLLSPHLDTPFTAWALGGPDRGDGLWVRGLSRHPLWAGHYRLRCGLDPGRLRRPSPAQLRRGARQAAAELALSLRLFGLRSWAGGNAYRLFFLYTRVLGLRLYFGRGEVCDPEDFDQICEAYQEYFPETRPWLERMAAEELRRPAAEIDAEDPAEVFYRHLPFLREQFDAAMAAQE